MVAIDIYLNETTRHADVILPPTTALERDHYDLVFHGLAVRNTARFTPAVLAEPDDARHDWEIFRDLARRVTARLDSRPPLAQRLRAAGPARGQPDAVSSRLLLAPVAGTSLRALRAHPEGVDLGPLRPDHAGPAADDRTSGSTWRPSSCVADLDRLREHARGRRPTRRAAADRPPAQAGQQLLDAQHHPADPGPAAPPAADASRRPRRPRPRPTARVSASPPGSARSRSRCRPPTT